MNDERAPVKAKILIMVVGGLKRGRQHKKRWKEVIKKDLMARGLLILVVSSSKRGR